jgi:error-prone DNA polymerase
VDGWRCDYATATRHSIWLIFLSLEDETGFGNVIVSPDLYERNPLVVTRSKFILVKGPLQNEDSVVQVKASHLLPLAGQAIDVRSHDFP